VPATSPAVISDEVIVSAPVAVMEPPVWTQSKVTVSAQATPEAAHAATTKAATVPCDHRAFETPDLIPFDMLR
jgi:hypothetical protein